MSTYVMSASFFWQKRILALCLFQQQALQSASDLNVAAVNYVATEELALPDPWLTDFVKNVSFDDLG